MSYYPEEPPPDFNVLRKYAMGCILVVMALWILATSGCAHAPDCERATAAQLKSGVVLECRAGKDSYGHPAKVCLVLRPGGKAAVAVRSCR